MFIAYLRDAYFYNVFFTENIQSMGKDHCRASIQFSKTGKTKKESKLLFVCEYTQIHRLFQFTTFSNFQKLRIGKSIHMTFTDKQVN